MRIVNFVSRTSRTANMFKFFGVIAFSAVIGFSLSGCGGDNDDEDTDDVLHLIAGTFKSPTNSGDAVFFADYATAGKSAVGAKSATEERELVGKIEDGDIIFNLKGVYDATSKMFFLSAGSSILVFQIVGTLTEGNMSNTEATVKIKSGDDWIVHTVAVTSVNPENVSINGDASSSQVDGVPAAWFGKWKQPDGVVYVVSAYQFVLLDNPNGTAGFLDIVSLGNGKYEMIWELDVTKCDPVETVPEGEIPNVPNCTTSVEYWKVQGELSGQNLLITVFHGSISNTYAVTKAYNTATASAGSKENVTLTRP